MLPELALIVDDGLRNAVRDIWVQAWQDSEWTDLAAVPKGTALSEESLVDHSRCVSLMSLAAAQTMRSVYGIDYQPDIVVAAALLHDVCKLVENEPIPGEPGSRYTERGRWWQHGFYGASKAAQHGLPDALVHAILAHTRKSGVTPQTHEAIVVHYADYLDSDCLYLRYGRPLLAARA